MSNRHTYEQLSVLLYGQLIGSLYRTSKGQLAFRYIDTAEDALSVMFPLNAQQEYIGRSVEAWFEGVLPDSMLTRMSMAKGKKYSYNSTFGLLSDYGYDLPGAIQVIPPFKLDEHMSMESKYSLITPEKIATRLQTMIKESEKSGGTQWHVKGEHWSLAGGQPKIALKRDEYGNYYECQGAAASNVIIKPGVSKMECQAEVEHVCLEIAKEIGLSTAQSSLVSFGDVAVLLVERYDRLSKDNGEILRIHQEDFCQALGVAPNQKYLERDNPFKHAVNLLNENTSEVDKTQFVDSILFNYLIGAPDAHLKNHSLLFPGSSDCMLAPLYDVASILPYLDNNETAKVAIKIGNEKRIGCVGKKALSNMAEELNISSREFINHYTNMAEKISQSIETVLNRLPDVQSTMKLHKIFKPRLQYYCENAVDNISSNHFTRPNIFAASNGLTLDDGNKNREYTKQIREYNNTLHTAASVQNNNNKSSISISALKRPSYSADEMVWVEPYIRRGKKVRGYWRKRPHRK